jgi:hypothetical protein
MSKKVWALIVLLIIMFVYVSYYYRSPSTVAILQSTLDEFELDMFLQKQPIVISDEVQQWESLKSAWFPSNKVDLFLESSPSDAWARNRYKYLLIQPYQSCEVMLYPANKKMNKENVPPEDETLLAIKMNPNQIIILPFRWHFTVSNGASYGWMGVHDWVTRFLPSS